MDGNRGGKTISLGDLNIIIYGGLGEIGGNIILLDYKGEKIVLDIGLSFSRYREYYEWPNRTHKGIDEMIRLGVAPNIEGLYISWKNKSDFVSKETDILGVFVSHAHMDHIGLLSQVNRNIDVFLGKTCLIIEGVRREVSRNTAYVSYEGINYNTFRTGDEIKIGPYIVKPIHVDHSVPGAYSFLIDTPEGRMLYTGDFRLHGEILDEKSWTRDMLEKAKEDDIEVMISEGTRFHDSSLESEEDVYSTFSRIFSRYDGDILMTFSYLDTDRFESLLKALGDSGREAVVSDRHFLFIWKLSKEDEVLSKKISTDPELIKIYIGESRVTGWRKKYYETWADEGYQLITYFDELGLGKYVYNDFDTYLSNLMTTKFSQGAIAIFSNSEPFNEEGMISQEKIYNWLASLNIPSYRVHCSGHIHPLDLKYVVNEIEPRKLCVIHSERPEALSRFLGYDPISCEKIR